MRYPCILIATAVFLVICAFQRVGHAVPAAPGVHTLRQPDGTAFRARQWGDENGHGWETEDGYAVLLDHADKAWKFAVDTPDGGIAPSFRRSGIDAPPSDIPKHLRPKGDALKRVSRKQHSKEMKLPGLQGQSGISTLSAPQLIVPPTGTAFIPVMLVTFSDRASTYSRNDFNSLLFGTGNYSMKDYYEEISYGQFSIAPGPGGVTGWYRAANSHDYYGQNNASGDDMWPGDLVYATVAAAAAAGFNFAPYDQDGDCYVDVINIIHQGSGEEAGGLATDIWSHRWSLAGAQSAGQGHQGVFTTNDNCLANPTIKVKVNDYVIQPELLWGSQQTMGVFAHEYGHALGLPDLYDTDNGSSNGIGNWSLMAGGTWNYVALSGDRPSHMDAWSKYKLGWTVPVQVSATLVNEQIAQAAAQHADVYQLLSGSPSGGGEYFLVENRQKTGFDAGLPGAGLLIWHIDESRSSNGGEWYPGCATCGANRYHVALLQADNLWELEKKMDLGDIGDPYKSGGNTIFDNSSLPNSNLYNGSASNVSITAISASAATMTATLSIGMVIDTSPPTGSISINSGAAYAAGPSGTLTLAATDPSGVGQMCISDTATCSSWEPFNATKAWTLPAGDGTKTVNVWFRDSLGNENATPYSDTIILDTTAPTGGPLFAVSGVHQVSLSWTGFSDAVSGIGSYTLVFSAVGETASCASGTLLYSGPAGSFMHSGLAAGQTYYYRLCATDNAGNVFSGVAASAYISTYRYVCSNGCAYGSLQDAINNAGPGDVIKIASGTYHENILIDSVKEITLIGGYDASSFSDPPAHDPSLTILDGDSVQPFDGKGDGSVISVTSGSTIALDNLTIMNGYAVPGQGGGISISSTAGAAILALQNTVIRNNAAEYGGGIFASSPDALQNVAVTAVNSFIVENAAAWGGAIFLGSSGTGSASLSLMNSTIAENRAGTAGSGAGIYAEQTGGSATTDVIVANSIIWGNKAKDTLIGDDISKTAAASVTAFYSDIGSGAFTAGTGVMTEDPVFINPSFYNYRINADSPAVNQGTAAGAPAMDFEGQSRDASPDMGADEFIAAVPSSVKLLSLNGGEIIQAGMPYDITWEAPVTAFSFKVFYSFDNGVTWLKPKSADLSVTGNIVNDQKHFRWNVPVLARDRKRCMIKVIGFNGLNGTGTKVGMDRSDLPFTISVVRIITPNGETPLKANTPTAVRWITTENLVATVTSVHLSYTTNGGLTWKPMILREPISGNPGEAVWITPALGMAKNNCKVKVGLYDTDNLKVGSDTSDMVFAIAP